MSKLDDIYFETIYQAVAPPAGTLYGINLNTDAIYQSLKSKIKDLMLELVGEDIKEGRSKDYIEGRNVTKVTIRNRIEEL